MRTYWARLAQRLALILLSVLWDLRRNICIVSALYTPTRFAWPEDSGSVNEDSSKCWQYKSVAFYMQLLIRLDKIHSYAMLSWYHSQRPPPNCQVLQIHPTNSWEDIQTPSASKYTLNPPIRHPLHRPIPLQPRPVCPLILAPTNPLDPHHPLPLPPLLLR